MTHNKLDWIQQKILDRDTLLRKCNIWRGAGKVIVFTNGCFDILHHGHLDYLVRAANLGNVLVIGLNTDSSVQRLKGPGRPINNGQDRAFQLASLLCVDAVCTFDEDTPKELIEAIRPDILVKGGDYAVDQIAGAEFVLANGGHVAVIPFVEGYSTTSMIDRIRQL